MMILRWLCRWFPSLRVFWIGIGYVMLITAGEIWFICFPLTAYTLYTAREFPLAYFDISQTTDTGFNYWVPDSMRAPLGGLCAAFALYGLIVIYINVRQLRDLRLKQK